MWYMQIPAMQAHLGVFLFLFSGVAVPVPSGKTSPKPTTFTVLRRAATFVGTLCFFSPSFHCWNQDHLPLTDPLVPLVQAAKNRSVRPSCCPFFQVQIHRDSVPLTRTTLARTVWNYGQPCMFVNMFWSLFFFSFSREICVFFCSARAFTPILEYCGYLKL